MRSIIQCQIVQSLNKLVVVVKPQNSKALGLPKLLSEIMRHNVCLKLFKNPFVLQIMFLCYLLKITFEQSVPRRSIT